MPGIDCGSTFAPVCRLQNIRMVLAIAAEYNLELAARLQHRVSERRCHRGSLRQGGTRIRAIRRKRSPELVAAALAMKEAVFCSNMMKELGFGTRFDSLPLYIDNTSVLQVAGNRTYSSRVKHVALRRFFIQELVKEGRNTVKYVKTED